MTNNYRRQQILVWAAIVVWLIVAGVGFFITSCPDILTAINLTQYCPSGGWVILGSVLLMFAIFVACATIFAIGMNLFFPFE